MWTRLKKVLAPPVFEGNAEKTRVARLLNAILIVELLVMVFSALLIPVTENFVAPLIAVVGFGLLALGMLRLTRLGYVRLAGVALTLGMWAAATILAFASGGVTSMFAIGGYMVVVTLAGVLLSSWATVIFSVLSLVTSGVVYVVEVNGILPPIVLEVTPLAAFAATIGNVSLLTALLYLASRGLSDALARVSRNAAQLEEQRAHLENEVRDRTRDLERRTRYLEATSVVAREASTVLGDPQQLLQRVVYLISQQFGFYHAGIFLLDPTGEWAVLRAASSEGGQRMLARDHRLRVGQVGTVGYVTSRGEPRIALDVGEDAVFFDNPDLPETRSAMTLPLRSRDEIIGALDVQSREPGAFSDEDVEVLEALADQVALAISNARLFQQTQEAAEAERRAYGELSREAWQRLLRTEGDIGFYSQMQETVAASDLWRPEMRMAFQTGRITPGEDGATLAIPVSVRGQVVGVIDGRKPEGTGTWTRDEIELLEALTDQINVALEGARLYRESQRRAVREQVTREITDNIRAASSVEDAMTRALQQIAQVLNASETVARLGPETHLLPSEEGVVHE